MIKNTRESVSVIIPTYNGLELLKKHLSTVISELSENDEIILVDDASSDNTLSYLIDSFSLKEQTLNNKKLEDEVTYYSGKNDSIDVHVLKNTINKRFGESCNRGVIIAKNKYVFLLNNDVSPHKGCIHALFDLKDEQTFAVACKEIEKDKLGNEIYGGKNNLWFEKGLFLHSRAEAYTTGETAWASGGSALFSKEKWEILGGFDHKYYPAYWEDIDLSFRARKKGWKVMFSENALVDHNHESTNTDAFGKEKMLKMSWKNADTFAFSHGNFFQKVSHVLWKPYWWNARRKTLRK